MQRRALGQTGLTVGALGFGCGAVGGLMVRGDSTEQVRAVARAAEAGVTYFDTAPSYGDGASETNLGQALRELSLRDRVLVGTKVRLNAGEVERPAPAVRRSLEESLRRLGLDRVDVVHLHNPIGIQTPDRSDAVVPVHLALGGAGDALRQAVEDGLVRHVGFTAIGATEAVKTVAADPAFETLQAYFNVLNPSGIRPGAAGGQQDFEGLIDHARAHGTGVMAIRIYAAGALSARSERHPVAWLPARPLIPGSDYSADLERARRLQRTATELGLESVMELGLRFALSAPGVSLILFGLSSVDHLEAALRWTERGPLPGDQVERLMEMATG